MSEDITYTHRVGTRWVMLGQQESVRQWGATSGGVYRQLEVHSRGDHQITDLDLRFSYSGAQATPLEVNATQGLSGEQVDLLIATLTEIRDHQKAQEAEREAWEKEQANSRGTQ